MLVIQDIKNRLSEINNSISLPEKKLALTAAATFSFLSLQMGICFSTAWPISFGVCLLNYYCDKNSPRPSPPVDWLGMDFSRPALVFWGAFTFFRPLALDILYSYSGLGNVALPQTGFIELLTRAPIQMIFVSCVVAPICEEILFRGVLMERLEDLTYLISEKFCKISSLAQKCIAGTIQSLSFAAMHLNQDVQKGYKLIVFCLHTYAGVYNTIWKETYETLISPIAIHSLNNGSFILLAFKQKLFPLS